MKTKKSEQNQRKEIERVIYAWNYLSWGGAQVYFLGLIKEVKKHFDVSVVMPEGSDRQLIDYFREQGVECEFFGPSTDKPPRNALTARIRHHVSKGMSEHAMLNALDKRFDLESSIVHVELSPWQSLLPLIWLSLRTQVFITMHNSLPPVNRMRRLLWKIKLRIISSFENFHAFASNKDARRYFKGLYSKEFYEGLKVTYTNVDPEEIDAALNTEIDVGEIRERHGIPKEAFVVICVGQFIDRKGRWTFLDAAKILAETSSGIHFVWVSNSKLTPEDEKRVDSYFLNTVFSLVASEDVGAEHIDLFKLVRCSDVFVLPSFQEGLPISLLEAMALELPCVSTRVNAIPEAVFDAKTGLLVEPGDAKGLAVAILKLKNNPTARQDLASAGRNIVLEKFNERAVAKIALDEYFKAADRKR